MYVGGFAHHVIAQAAVGLRVKPRVKYLAHARIGGGQHTFAVGLQTGHGFQARNACHWQVLRQGQALRHTQAYAQTRKRAWALRIHNAGDVAARQARIGQ